MSPKVKQKGNQHFATEQWADFANGQVPEERRRTMQQHLDSGCKECAPLFSLWQRVGQTAQRESTYEPPDSAVRHVRGAFAILADRRKRASVFEIPRLVFDSHWQAAMVGVRSSTSAPRQVLYRAGDLAVEIRLEPQPGSSRVNIAGQLSGSGHEAEGIPGIPIVVSGSKGLLAETTTNDFGEFDLAVVPEAGMRLLLDVPNHRKVSIPLEGSAIGPFHR